MSHRDNYNKSGPHLSHVKDNKKSDLSPIEADDWSKTIGKTLISKDGLDMAKIVKDDDDEVDYQTSLNYYLVW
jgi:hypothetical protein